MSYIFPPRSLALSVTAVAPHQTITKMAVNTAGAWPSSAVKERRLREKKRIRLVARRPNHDACRGTEHLQREQETEQERAPQVP